MSKEPENPPVVIVGGGIAGLCCARVLAAAGRPWLLVEAGSRLGGRIASEAQDGFILDRGFQVYLDSYPEARRVLDHARLDLGRFYPGALLRTADGYRRVANPLRRPLQALRSLFGGPFSLGDGLAVLRLGWAALGRGRTRDDAQGAESSDAWLRRVGVSERAIETFFRPFFGGVFLETALATPRPMLEFVFAMFARGAATLPAGGMGALPAQLAEPLPRANLRFDSPVERIAEGGVVLHSRETIAARAVVLATEWDEAARLRGDAPAGGEGWSATTTLYFDASPPPVDEPILVLNATGRGPINHVCVPSRVAPSYAPAGRDLVSVSLIGTSQLDDAALEHSVRTELAEWFGDATRGWRHLRTYRIARALPRRFALGSGAATAGTRLGHRLYACGDYTQNPSINGAMLSGRLAGEALLADLGAS